MFLNTANRDAYNMEVLRRARNALDMWTTVEKGVTDYLVRLREVVAYSRVELEQRRGKGTLLGIGEHHSIYFTSAGEVLEEAIPYFGGGSHESDMNIQGECKKVVKQLLETAFSIDYMEAALLVKLHPDVVYSEGRRRSNIAIAAYVASLEPKCTVNIIYLDDGNPYYLRMLNGNRNSPDLQTQREAFWAERMGETVNHATTPVMIVGMNHMTNKYGLLDALRERGIVLEPLVV